MTFQPVMLQDASVFVFVDFWVVQNLSIKAGVVNLVTG